MQHITAIAFDLFDTLITVEKSSRYEAPGRLLGSLQAQGLTVDHDTFMPIYRDVVQTFLRQARQDGKETHNRFWISTTLQRLGHEITPDDPRIMQAVEAYFSAFLDYAVLLPDTREMLTTLKRRYRLGLLSNLTHAPAARQILDHLELTPFFDVLLVSGELGYRKPHATVFRTLIEQLQVPSAQIAFVGDDLEADINGSQQVGLQPIWTAYAQAYKAAAAVEPEAVPAQHPDPAVPTITSWTDLLSLFNLT